MPGSTQTPSSDSPQTWNDLRAQQRGAATASLSFPSKPPGASQLSHSRHAAIQAAGNLHDWQIKEVDLLNHHYQQSTHVVAPPVHTTQEEGDIAIHGPHSFELGYDGQTDLCRISVDSQLSDGIRFALFSDSLTKRDPYENPIYSELLPFPAPYQRSLTSNWSTLSYEMTPATTAPNSPPDLSGSKSSKSSSIESSHFDSHDGITNDVSDFEEIGLGEVSQVPDQEPTAWDRNNASGKRSSSRVALISTRPIVPARDLTTSYKRPTYPSLQGQVEQALSNANPNGMGLPRSGAAGGSIGLRRGFTAPSSATLPMPMPIPGCQPRTRSSSPIPKQPASAGFATTGYNVRSGPVNRSTGPPSRRGSWQPSRRTIKELEAEYHDSDDELPDDTSLWNVPMSPRPPTARASSARSSHRGSPERDVVIDGPQPIPLSHAVSAPESPKRHPMSQSDPRNRPPPRTSSLQPVTSMPSSPTSPKSRACFRDTRATSWTLAMEDLSEEARVLTQTLEFHADSKGRIHEENIQNGTTSSRPSLESNTRRSARSSQIELPPIQKRNILIDPMPLSKEKEAVLTRTRPSWLPPKDPKEEKRHLREYQRMMAASVDAEKRREEKVRVQRYEKDESREQLNRVWERYVCPDWERVTHEHRTRELWWRGVNPKLRGQIWMRAVGNPLGLSHMSYKRALQRVKELQARDVEELNEKERSMRAWFSDIERDATSVFPGLNLFQQKGPMWQELVDVCCAYVSYRSDVGYLYGIQVSHPKIALQEQPAYTLKNS